LNSESRAYLGAFHNFPFWATTIKMNENKTASIHVIKQEPLDKEPTQTYEGQLSKTAAKIVWREAARVSLWTLARTDYASTMSDDCYHLGVSVEVNHSEFGRFCHQIPTGPCVLVSSTNPNPAEVLRFVTFVLAIAELAEKQSNVLLPPHVRLRWESRVKELTLGGTQRQN
jgi:hypothetical protein